MDARGAKPDNRGPGVGAERPPDPAGAEGPVQDGVGDQAEVHPQPGTHAFVLAAVGAAARGAAVVGTAVVAPAAVGVAAAGAAAVGATAVVSAVDIVDVVLMFLLCEGIIC